MNDAAVLLLTVANACWFTWNLKTSRKMQMSADILVRQISDASTIWRQVTGGYRDAGVAPGLLPPVRHQDLVAFDRFKCSSCGWNREMPAGNPLPVVKAYACSGCGLMREAHLHASCLECNGAWLAQLAAPAMLY